MRNLRYITLIIFAALLAACGAQNPAQTATLSPQQLQPTLNAQFTQFALTGTPPSQDPALAATLSTPLSEEQFAQSLSTPQATAAPNSGPTATLAQGASPTTAPQGGRPTAEGLSPRQEASGGITYPGAVPPVTPQGDLPGALTGGDTYATTLIDSLQYGQTVEENMATDIEGHNWEFIGAAGDAITITVRPLDGADPRVKLIAPDGSLLASRDSAGDGGTETITATLQQGGVFTVRIDMWTRGGTYQLTVTN